MPLFRTPRLPIRSRSTAPYGPTPVGNVGLAAGTSTVSGAAVPLGVGASAGAGAATAVGAATAAGAGAASAIASVVGVSPSTSIFPLTVDASGRYLKQNDGTPFLICGDSTWEISVNLTTADQITFLNNCVTVGVNAVMANAIEHHYSVVKAPKNIDGDLPFTQTMNGASYTGSPNGTPAASGTQAQFAADPYANINNQAPDCTFFNATYWDKIDAFISACLDRDIAVFIWPMYLGFHGNQEGWISELTVWDAVIGAGGLTGQPFANGTKSKLYNYGAALAARWATYPNIIWVAGGDFGSGGQTMNAAQLAACKSCIDGIKSVSGLSTLWTAHWDRPCISDDTAISGVTWDLNFAYSGDEAAEETRRAYAVAATKPAYWGEGFYEAGLFGGSLPFRRYLYWGFLGGICGGFYGHEQLWRFDDGSPGTLWSTLLATQGRLDAARQYAFFKDRPWHRLKPSGLGGMGTIVTVGGGTASPQTQTYVSAACTPEGDLLLAYVPPAHTGSITIDMTKMSGTAVCRWFDPTNATYQAASPATRDNTGTQAFTPPATNSAGETDFLLVLETSVAEAAGTSTVAGVGAALASGAGTSAGTSTVAGVGRSTAAGAGAAAGVGAAAAISTTVLTGAGASAGTSNVAGVGAALTAGVGAAAGTSAVAGAGAALAAGTGAASGAATVAAIGAPLAAGVGTATGTGTAAGTGAPLAAGVGGAAGTSTVNAAGASTTEGSGVGAAAGAGTVAAVGAALADGVGAAAGESTTSGAAATSAGAGAAAGTSTAAAAGAALVSSTGAAAGTSTVAGFSDVADPMAALEEALHAWVMIGSQLDADHVIWCPEGVDPGPVPTGTYIELRLININRVSDDWTKLTRSGNSIVHHVRGTRHPTLQLTCIAGDRYGAMRPSKILERVLTSVSLPSVRAVLRGIVGIGPRGQINVITARRSGLFDPRATVEVGLHTVIEIYEVAPEMKRVNVETPGVAAVWVPDPPE